MIPPFVAPIVLAGFVSAGLPAALQHSQRIPLPGSASVVLENLARRLHAYIELRDGIALMVPPIEPTTDIVAIQRRVDRLAIGIRAARSGARQGDILSSDSAALLRQIIRTTCRGRFTDLLAIINEDWESPLPPAVIHGRWPDDAPLPTMPPDLLAALPALPPGLEYRFINRDLVLRDIDANLIIDFVPEAIPAASWTLTSR